MLLAFSSCNQDNEEDYLYQQDEKSQFEIYDGIYITAIEPYTGKSYEDESNKEVEDVMCVTIMNTSEQNYEHFNFTINIGEEIYTFYIDSLLSVSKVKVLEITEKICPYDTSDFDAVITEMEEFKSSPDLYNDIFEISAVDGIISIKNNSDIDYNNVYIYFKQYINGEFFGGKTYRTKVGSISSGEFLHIDSPSFVSASMQIIYVTVN